MEYGLFKKLTVPNLVKKFPTVCGTQGFINHVHSTPLFVPPGLYQASSCPPLNLMLEDPPIYPWIFQLAPYFMFPHQNPVCISPHLHIWHMPCPSFFTLSRN
jgi:hypothetical protein